MAQLRHCAYRLAREILYLGAKEQRAPTTSQPASNQVMGPEVLALESEENNNSGLSISCSSSSSLGDSATIVVRADGQWLVHGSAGTPFVRRSP